MPFCSCIPPPASLQPRKVYNNLVPDVFPMQPPDPDSDVPKSVERKMEKLAEYLQKNPARTAKARLCDLPGGVAGAARPSTQPVDHARRYRDA